MFVSRNLSSCVSSPTTNRNPMNAKSMAEVRIWVNMIGDTAESSNFTILEHKKYYVYIFISTFMCHQSPGEYH
jgi:hypothetical protein